MPQQSSEVLRCCIRARGPLTFPPQAAADVKICQRQIQAVGAPIHIFGHTHMNIAYARGSGLAEPEASKQPDQVAGK